MAAPEDTQARQRLDSVETQIQTFYDQLGDLAEALELETSLPDGDDLDLNNLEQRMAWDEIRGYILAARHELHGGLTAIIWARGRAPRWRPTS
jgi:hypothetical protein